MKRATISVLLFGVTVGCFSKPTANVQTIGKSIVSQEPVQTQAPVQADVAATASQEPEAEQIVTAQDAEMVIAGIEAGDPALEEAVTFSSDRAGTVIVKPSVFDELRLFRVRSDQFGQTELVANLQSGQNGVQVSLPAAGTYLVAGKEKPLPFADIPLGADREQAQYQVQTVGQGCPSVERDLMRSYGGYPVNHSDAWTRDTEFPAKAKVYLHRGAGNSSAPEDSFDNWVNYNKTQSPDKEALADRVREYVPDLWDSYPAPDVVAEAYNKSRSNCGTPGEAYVDVCHSAGCLKVWLALFWRTHGNWTRDNIGIIAAAPAIGGSHWAIKDLTDASLAFNYKDKAAHWGSVRALVQWEWGMLLSPSVQKTFLKDTLAGTRFSLYNEGARSLAWTGAGTGIPTTNYPWYSLFNFGLPYLQLRLKPETRYTMPAGNPLADFAPSGYTWPGDTQRMFNYIEAVQALNALTAETARTDGKMDVAVCYLNESPTTQSTKIKQFEKEYGNGSVLNLLWRNLAEPGLKRRFAKAALPWMNAVIAKSPSVVPNNPDPNENAVNDGALTMPQQLGLLDGPSILAPGSKYGALTINKTAVDARLPRQVAGWREFPGREHKQAVEGDPELWDWMNSKLIARVDKLREEERSYVLTDEHKKRFLEILSPRGGEQTFDSDWDSTINMHRTKTTYTFELSSIQYIQDPLETGQRNRIRIIGNGWMTKDIKRWNDLLIAYIGSLDDLKDRNTRWEVNEDFIVRNGVFHLVVK